MLRKEVGRVLMELSKVDQCYDAVLAVMRDGLTISEAAITYGVSRQTIYRWMRRYEEGGLVGFGSMGDNWVNRPMESAELGVVRSRSPRCGPGGR